MNVMIVKENVNQNSLSIMKNTAIFQIILEQRADGLDPIKIEDKGACGVIFLPINASRNQFAS